MTRTRRVAVIASLLLVASMASGATIAPQNTPPLKPSTTFKFEKYTLLYPNVYTAQPLAFGEPGGFFLQTNPFGFLFAVMSRRGEDTVIPQGRALANAMLARLARGHTDVVGTVTDIPASELPPATSIGKALDADTGDGLHLHANFYLTELDGRKVLVGYATMTGENIKPELRPLLTTYPADIAEDFRQMLASLRVH